MKQWENAVKIYVVLHTVILASLHHSKREGELKAEVGDMYPTAFWMKRKITSVGLRIK